jgi:hypothetical protein
MRIHAHIGDQHLILACVQLGYAFARGCGSVDIEPTDLQYGFQRQQHSNFIVNQQNAAFHSIPF